MELNHWTEVRRRQWCQDGRERIATADEAEPFIERLGIVTLYGVVSEIPSLMLAYVSQPEYKNDTTWDSPSGEIYTWRWALGKKQSAFYSSIISKKPTFVAWRLLPAVLGALMDRTDPERAYADGVLSADALSVWRALDRAEEPLETGDLREAAGFPTGKENRAAYLRAVEELEAKLWLAKSFVQDPEDLGMRHALVSKSYPEPYEQALGLSGEEALAELLLNLLESAVYLDLKVVARALRVPEAVLLSVAKKLQDYALQGKLLLPK